MNVIVIDDEPSSLLAFASQIIDNASVTANMFKNNFDDALEFARSKPVKAAFLDIVMPGFNGVDLAEKLIKINPGIKIVFITGYAQDVESIKSRIGKNFYGFCYKPYDPETVTTLISGLLAENDKVRFKTFSHFDCFVGNTPVDFPRAKSKELLALLVDRRGATVTMDEAITCLWKEKPADLAKKLYRDAVCRLKLALKNYHAERIIDVKRARLFLKTEFCVCDLWDYLDGDEKVSFHGEYMRPYEWSIERESELCGE